MLDHVGGEANHRSAEQTAAGPRSRYLLQSDDSLRLQLDLASDAQTPSTPNGASILSALKDMTDEDRAALLRAISEQFSTSLVASTPKGQGFAAIYTTPATKMREKTCSARSKCI